METIADRPSGQSKPDREHLPGTSPRARILIVDDEVKNIKLFKAFLAPENYELITAENGQEALFQVRQNSPDAILLDIMMPGINGFEVTRRLKQNEATAGIPIILVTALSGDENRTRGLNAGADEFLTKPVQRAELVARVGSMLKLKRFQEQLCGRQQTEVQMDAAVDNPLSGRERISTILIVEDDEKDALLLQKQIEHEPFLVKRVASGEAAVAEALNKPTDLILLDIMLPGMDGFEVCQRLKGDDQTKNIQIAMITSLRDLEYRIRGTEQGADDYLVKPVESRELKARVNALLKKKSYIDKLHSRYEEALNRAISDGLTGLFNHAYFKRFFELEIKRSLRQKHPISLLLLDLDNFKQVNDRLGHLTGDRVLVEVAKAIKNTVREVDFAARYGGEEFAVILPYADMETARDVAERIRQAIYTNTGLHGSKTRIQPISASIGIALFPDDGLDIEVLIRKADEMMYLAKQCGKNQVCVSIDFKE